MFAGVIEAAKAWICANICAASEAQLSQQL